MRSKAHRWFLVERHNPCVFRLLRVSTNVDWCADLTNCGKMWMEHIETWLKCPSFCRRHWASWTRVLHAIIFLSVRLWIPSATANFRCKKVCTVVSPSAESLNYAALEIASDMSHNMQHDDVIKWKHFPRHWPLVRGIHRSPVNSPHKGQWRWALLYSLICVWINRGWWFETLSRWLWRHCNNFRLSHHVFKQRPHGCYCNGKVTTRCHWSMAMVTRHALNPESCVSLRVRNWFTACEIHWNH